MLNFLNLGLEIIIEYLIYMYLRFVICIKNFLDIIYIYNICKNYSKIIFETMSVSKYSILKSQPM